MDLTHNSALAQFVSALPLSATDRKKARTLLAMVEWHAAARDRHSDQLDRYLTLFESMVGNVSTTSTDVQVPLTGSSSETSVGAAYSFTGVYGERAVDKL